MFRILKGPNGPKLKDPLLYDRPPRRDLNCYIVLSLFPSESYKDQGDLLQVFHISLTFLTFPSSGILLFLPEGVSPVLSLHFLVRIMLLFKALACITAAGLAAAQQQQVLTVSSAPAKKSQFGLCAFIENNIK